MVGGPWARDLLGISAIGVVKGGGIRLLHNRRWLQTHHVASFQASCDPVEIRSVRHFCWCFQSMCSKDDVDLWTKWKARRCSRCPDSALQSEPCPKACFPSSLGPELNGGVSGNQRLAITKNPMRHRRNCLRKGVVVAVGNLHWLSSDTLDLRGRRFLSDKFKAIFPGC